MIRNARLLVSSLVVAAAFLLSPLAARAQDAGVTAALVAAGGDGGDAGATPADAAVEADGGLSVTPFGVAETTFVYNPASPSNGQQAYRLNDARRGFSIPNAVFGADASYGIFSLHLAFQVGLMPEIYYSASDASTFSHVQEAYGGVKLGPVTATCGVYLSPVGPESMNTNLWSNTLPGVDAPGTSAQNAANATISRPYAFFGLPFYHTGCRGALDLGRGYTLNAWIVNGWNSVVDNNSTPSGILNLQYAAHALSWSVLAMVGPERDTNAREGSPIRVLFDSWVQWHPHDRLSFVGQFDGGFESNRFGLSGWLVGSLAARWHFHPRLYLAARGEIFREWIGSNSEGSAAPIFWRADTNWISSFTATLGWRPHRFALLRVEYRHGQAGGNVFYAGQVMGDGSLTNPFVPNASAEDTVSAAATLYFQ